MVKTADAETYRNIKGRSEEKHLEVEEIFTFYGEAQALKSVSLHVCKKEVVAILGSNGAGKTTLLRTVTGLIVPRSGRIKFEHERIDGIPPYEIIKKGIASVPEGRELFGTMTVGENLEIGTYSLSQGMRKKVKTKRLEMVFALFPILKERLKQRAETLSGGQQQMLAIGRALMANPKLLALDEPSLGLSPLLVSEVMQVLKKVCWEINLSVLLVEQNARAALKIANYVYVLERGQVLLSGICEDIISSPAIQRAYLGG